MARTLVALALGLHALDMLTTLAGLRLGVADEGNPPLAALLRLGGPGVMVVGSSLSLVAALALVAALERRWRRHVDPFVRAAPLVGLALLVVLTAATVANNVAVLHG